MSKVFEELKNQFKIYDLSVDAMEDLNSIPLDSQVLFCEILKYDSIGTAEVIASASFKSDSTRSAMDVLSDWLMHFTFIDDDYHCEVSIKIPEDAAKPLCCFRPVVK